MRLDKHDQVKIRLTHPTMYWWIMMLSFMGVAQAANFWFGPRAAFTPYDIPQSWVGWAFFVLGVWQLIFLNAFHSLLMVRIGLAFAFVFLTAWGVVNTEQVFNGPASFQLPILYFTLGVMAVKFLTEAPVNPTTQRKEKP